MTSKLKSRGNGAGAAAEAGDKPTAEGKPRREPRLNIEPVKTAEKESDKRAGKGNGAAEGGMGRRAQKLMRVAADEKTEAGKPETPTDSESPQPESTSGTAAVTADRAAKDSGEAAANDGDKAEDKTDAEVAAKSEDTGAASPPAVRQPAQPPAPDTAAETAPDVAAAEAAPPEKERHWRIAPSSVNFEDPLLSCLSIVAGLIQKPISEQALKAGLPHGGERFTPELAMQAAHRAGMGARLVRRPKVANILKLTLPCILLLKGGNACVLRDFPSDDQAEIINPEGGTPATVKIGELQEQYTGYTIFVRAEFKFDSRSSDIKLSDPRRWFWGTLGKFWPIYSHVVLASILINCFAIASPLFIMNVYDRVVPNNALETLWVLAAGVATVFVFEFIMRNMRTYFVDTAGKNADVIIASRLLERVMAMKLDKKPPSTGALANNLREFESLREFFTSGTLVAFVDLPFVFLFVLVIWLISGPVAFVPLAVIPIVIGAGLILQFPLRNVIEKTHRESTQKHALLFETIDGLETIKAVAAEGRVQRAWERFVGMAAQSAGKAAFISGIATTTAQLSVQMTTVAVVVFGVHQIAQGNITMGALIAATILTGRALQPLGAVAAMLTRLQHSRVALKGLDSIMKTPVEREEGKTFLHRPHLSGKIEFQNVSFGYPGQQTKALDGSSFSLEPGERVAILGRVGSGKSTIARLLMGLYEPAEGAVLMDGTDARQIDPADLRRNIGYVSQDNYLFFGSVRDNISFGAPHVDERTIMRAAEIAGVNDFVQGHPLGYDLPVGERGMALSGGQRQAIVVARALLQDPPILMMDEPTSSMDNASEALFKSRLEEVLPGKSLIMVTHRGSLLSLVDRLIVMDGGKIVADGPKDEVLKALRSGQVKATERPKAQGAITADAATGAKAPAKAK